MRRAGEKVGRVPKWKGASFIHDPSMEAPTTLTTTASYKLFIKSSFSMIPPIIVQCRPKRESGNYTDGDEFPVIPPSNHQKCYFIECRAKTYSLSRLISRCGELMEAMLSLDSITGVTMEYLCSFLLGFVLPSATHYQPLFSHYPEHEYSFAFENLPSFSIVLKWLLVCLQAAQVSYLLQQSRYSPSQLP